MPSSPSAIPTFFLDRSLGKKTIGDLLRDQGMGVEMHDDHFLPDCGDEVWIPAVAKKGWLILTKDKRIRKREGHLEGLRSAGAVVFVLTSGDATGADNAQAFLKALNRMTRIAARYARPLIATVGASGVVTILEGVRRGGIKR